MPETPKPFYLTTPIYYVNARPHIGHAYTTIVGDVLARRHRLLGEDVFFLTGTDEHGQKIERSAAAAGIPPRQFADQVSKTFSDLFARMGITNNDFIRTTSEKHKRGAQHLFAELYKNGHIYLDSYTGQYSIGEEMFVEGPPGTIGPDGKPTETVTEENFFFRLSNFQKPLLDLIESDTLKITPESAKNEVLSFVRGGLRDLSVSRSSFTWGIPVPEPAASLSKQKHVIYVWLDALANYMTALGYGSDDDALWQKFWPADLHLVGKEITRFHCVYWPAFLMAAGLPTSKAITANGWLLFDNAKMSKSKGNVVRTETILEGFGTLCPLPANPSSQAVILSEARSAQPKDPEGSNPAAIAEPISATPTKAECDLFATDVLRYYLLREIPFGQDGSFSFDAMITRYNADLAGGYGNLVSRTLAMTSRAFPNGFARVHDWDFGLIEVGSSDNVSRFRVGLREHDDGSNATFEQVFHKTLLANNFARSLDYPWVMIRAVDRYISDTAPWKLMKLENAQSKFELEVVLYSACESIRHITALLYPILPFATAKVWAQLGLGDIELAARNGELKNLKWGGLKPGTKLGPLSPIFPRADKGLADIMTDLENQETSKLASSKLTADQVPSTADPAAGPRTASLDEPTGTLTVAGSAAHTTGPDGTPSHTEAQASGIFAAPAATLLSPLSFTPSETIAIDDFIKIDLRVAEIVLAERIPKADKLLRLEVDLGPLGRRQILSGIAEWYTPEDLTGRRILVIANLAPRKMRGLESNGMLLAASEEGGKPFLATVPEGVAVGTRLK